MVCLLGLSISGALWAAAASESTGPVSEVITNTPAAAGITSEVTTNSSNGGALTEWELKIQALNDSLAAANQTIQDLTRSGGRMGRLGVMERKALAYDAAYDGMMLKDQAIAALRKDLKASREEAAVLRKDLERMAVRTNDMAKAVADMEREKKVIQNTLDIIRLGRYEYYEVKEGDTCESIAALPTIYNDRAKQVLIRQANRGNVTSLDKLVPGQVIIIPRFPVGGPYEF